MLTVHLRINDAATGRPTPVRLRISGRDGTAYPPFGRLAEFAPGADEDVGGHIWLDKRPWCYIDGTCEVPLPAGVPLRVQATKGPEYTPLDQTVTLGPGQMSLRLAVERWSNVRADGWFPGDARCHSLSPHAALLEAEAEDLSVVQLLAREGRFPSLDGDAYPSVANMVAFSGQGPALSSDTAAVAVNTLNRHPVLGTVGLLHSHRAVFPLAFGGPDHADDWSVSDWCDQCHRKGGLVTWVDPPTGGEALAALLLGKIDAVEVDDRSRKVPLLPWYYRLLDLGLRVPLVGASGKDSNTTPLGRVRTYARLTSETPLTLGSWVEAVRAGRCFATAGPLLSLTADGHGLGETIQSAGETTAVQTAAASQTWFERLELVANGEVVAAVAPSAEGPRWVATVEHVLPVRHSGWVAARTTGTGGGFSHSAPVWVVVPDRPSPRRQAAVLVLRRLLEQGREWVDDTGRFTSPGSRDRLLARFAEALDRL